MADVTEKLACQGRLGSIGEDEGERADVGGRETVRAEGRCGEGGMEKLPPTSHPPIATQNGAGLNAAEEEKRYSVPSAISASR